MLDAETKRKIDNCRDVLVGKIPDPKSQVEQITIALIYKFMDDMDQLSVYQGGKPSFFRGEFEKYSWSSIFNPRISGFELLNLYGEALIKMNQNPNIPQLFRDIFKNAFQPYRDPETLRLFLKEIHGFTYDHSERLGDAFEYLLSVLSSQGDAGQFRTPRHIIDFIVKVVDPQLNETILDPACGTAGFLISAYKHILRNNPNLSTTQKQRLMNNFVGYDISYDMVRLSLVNMYLHGFPQPHIHEYDTLTSEDRWQDTFDVIMANPPFMTPKGGIRPHSRFSIQAKRSEVLFVDYIAEHLNPSGRGGVIVPEGIIFQSQNAYKALRKMLVENYLWAVVSLPVGVFNPYSAVKTSILLMDKSLAKRIDKILFVKIQNDGYDLGAQRRPIDKNDLTAALKFLNIYKSKIINYKSKIEDSPLALAVPKSEIAKSGDYNLTGDRYRPTQALVNQKWPMVRLNEVCEIISDEPPIFEGEKKYYSTGTIDLDRPKSFELVNYKNRATRANIYPQKCDVGFAVMKNTNKVVYISDVYEGSIFSTGLTFLRCRQKLEPKYIFYLLKDANFQNIKDSLAVDGIMGGIRKSEIKNIQIPLPPLEVQGKIVAEIDGYHKIIDAARQIVENYKPTIKINPAWPMIRLGDIANIMGGFAFKSGDFVDSGIQVIRMGNIEMGRLDLDKNPSFMPIDRIPEFKDYIIQEDDVLITMTGTQGKRDFGEVCLIRGRDKYLLNQRVGKFVFDKKKVRPQFLAIVTSSPIYQDKIFPMASGVRQANVSPDQLESIEIPLPSLETQDEIISQIEAEQKIVNENKRLIEIFEQKITDKIGEVWGEK